MNCKQQWNQDTLDDIVTKTFRKVTLKKHRENVLYEHEKSLLPATQTEAQRVKQIRHHQEVLKELGEKRTKMLQEINETIYGVERNIRQLQRGDAVASESFLKEKRVFTIPCPQESCRGFIEKGSGEGDTHDWKCGTCGHYACSKCHEYLGETKHTDHECVPENIETAKMLKKETKSCPGCSALIFKISGCNQMWCTQCHTTFNWTTGLVEKGATHNPHFYEWMQRNGGAGAQRNLGDIPCGGLVDIYQLQRYLNKFPKPQTPRDATQKPKTTNRNLYPPYYGYHGRNHYPQITNDDYLPEVASIFTIHRICSHIQNVELATYRVNANTNNLDLRVKYLLNEVTDDALKLQLQQREKKYNKMKEIYDVLEMYTFTMVDMFRNLVSETDTTSYDIKVLADWRNQVLQLQSFANEQLKKISVRFSCVVPRITDTNFSTNYY
jgi:hypothetical protein